MPSIEALSTGDRIMLAVVREPDRGQRRIDMVQHPRMIADRQVQPALVVEHHLAAIWVNHPPNLVHPATVWSTLAQAQPRFATPLREGGDYVAKLR
jgi:hypothetical protein